MNDELGREAGLSPDADGVVEQDMTCPADAAEEAAAAETADTKEPAETGGADPVKEPEADGTYPGAAGSQGTDAGESANDEEVADDPPRGTDSEVPEPEVIAPDGKKSKKVRNPVWKGFRRGLALGIVLIIAVEAALLAVVSAGPDRMDIIGIVSKLRTIENMIDEVYLYDADKKDMTDGIFYGMIEGLTEDRYAQYYSVESFNEETKKLTGSYVGVGITIYEDPEGRGIFISAVNVDGPAARAGIKENDIIIEADGVSLVGASSNDAVSLITGEEGTEVVIKLLRDGEELEFTVPREKITSVSVHYRVITEEEIGNVRVKGTSLGYISITAFNQATRPEFEEAVLNLVEDQEVSGLIIDLRNNGGGDMEICLSMIDCLLDDELELAVEVTDEEYAARRAADEYAGDTLLLTVEGKDNRDNMVFYAGDGSGTDVPIAVVVNGGSASASEIFTGVLRDYGYTVVGTKTYGKGIVQTLYNLDDGSAVKFTTDQYRLPGGELIHGAGIEPTIEVEFKDYDNETEDTVNYADGSEQDLMGDVQIAAAVSELEQQIYDAYQGE